MAPAGRSIFPAAPDGARHASVAALLYHLGDVLHLLFIQRTSPPGDRHGGQISFPGGSRDAGDADPLDTALRETEEEVGLRRDRLRVLGALTPLYIPVSNFQVAPYVFYAGAYADLREMKLRPQASEVARILSFPFADFLLPATRRVGTRKLASGRVLAGVPFWAVGGEEVWGATSMIVAELVALTRPPATRR